MKTLILGSGAIGSIIAAYLTVEDRDVSIADPWFQHVEKVRTVGLQVQAVDRDFDVRLRALQMDELDQYGKADVVVISCKSYDTRLMALIAREHLLESTVVMSAQNGMNDDRIASIVGRSRMVGSVVVMGGHLLDAGTVRRTSPDAAGSLILGNLYDTNDHTLEQMEDYFSPLGGLRISTNIWPDRWSKLTLNSMSNTMAGLSGLKTSTLWSNQMCLDVIIALGHECALVAQAAGIKMAPVFSSIPHELLLSADKVGNLSWRGVQERMLTVSGTRTGNRRNIPSLLQDVLKGRRTEVHYLNGCVASEGRRMGVATPMNDMLIAAFSPIEIGDQEPGLGNVLPLGKAVSEQYG